MEGLTKQKARAIRAKYKTKAHKKVKNLVIPTRYENKIYRSLKNLRRQVSKYKSWEAKVRLSLKVARKYMGGPRLVKIVENLANTVKVVKEREKNLNESFTIQQKILALLVMRKSALAYEFLCLILYLPPRGTLIKLLKMRPEENVKTYICTSLKSKAKELMKKVSLHCDFLRAAKKARSANLLRKGDLYCIVLFKEFNLKIHFHSNTTKDLQASISSKVTAKAGYADHCLVFMIRGIWEDLYKVPAAYVFYKGQASPSELAHLVQEEIRRLQMAMFIPIATICNEEGCNKGAVNYLVFESNRKFKSNGKPLGKNVFFVDGQEIVPLYDPPQLLVAMRNHLLRNNLKYTIEKKGADTHSGTAKWEHIVEFYKFCHRDGRCDYVPKVTRRHFYPKNVTWMKLDDATPIFSHKLAAFMGHSAGLVGKQLISRDCIDTAFLLKFFNDLFDSVNGNRKESRYNDHNKLLTKVKLKSIHYTVWRDSVQSLRTMKFLNKTGEEVNITTINSWIWTMEGFQALMRNIFFNTILDGVWMRYFNQDPLNAMFKDYCDDKYLDIRKYCGY